MRTWSLVASVGAVVVWLVFTFVPMPWSWPWEQSNYEAYMDACTEGGVISESWCTCAWDSLVEQMGGEDAVVDLAKSLEDENDIGPILPYMLAIQRTCGLP